jgi:hypothetical protein
MLHRRLEPTAPITAWLEVHHAVRQIPRVGSTARKVTNFGARAWVACGRVALRGRYSLIVRTTLEVGRPSLTGPFTCFMIASS